MAWTYDQLITQLTSDYESATAYLASARNDNLNAMTAWVMGNDHSAISHLISGATQLGNAIEMILSEGLYGWNGLSHSLTDALDRNRACPFLTSGEVEVTMDSLLSAMITSDYDQLQKFIGLVDAYRVAIWGQPFNVEFYAALARGFMP